MVAAERELQVPRLRFGMTKFKWLVDLGVGLLGWRVLTVVAAERELQVPRLRFGMTKFKWLVALGVGYTDGEF